MIGVAVLALALAPAAQPAVAELARESRPPALDAACSSGPCSETPPLASAAPIVGRLAGTRGLFAGLTLFEVGADESRRVPQVRVGVRPRLIGLKLWAQF